MKAGETSGLNLYSFRKRESINTKGETWQNSDSPDTVVTTWQYNSCSPSRALGASWHTICILSSEPALGGGCLFVFNSH